MNVTDADVRHGAGDFRSALQELVQEQVYSNVDFVEVAEPQTDPTEDDYVVAYEASFTPRDLVHAYLKIIITNEGHVGIGLETRMRLAERVGARLWTAKETFAAGRELASITPSELISFVRLVAQGRVMLQVSFGFGLIGFGATRAVMSPEDFQSLGSQRPRSWDWLRVLTKEQSDASRRTIVRYEPW